MAEVEQAHAGEPFGEFYDDIHANATGCVMLSFAALDAYANELFIDWQKHLAELPAVAMKHIWSAAERSSVLARFELFLDLRGAPPLDRGDATYQNIEALRQLRNALTHFRPEWDDEREVHERVSRTLESRFARSPFLPDPESLFPLAWASSGCAAWAIESCRSFASAFSTRSGLDDRFEKFSERLEIR